MLERARKVLAGGVSSEFRKYNHPHAIFYTHGKGSRIYDVDGNEYLDFTLSQGPLLLGHSHPQVLKAVTEYSEQGQLFAGQHIKEIALAEKLNQLFPSAEMMRFCLDGSEAVQTAFRVARAKTGRQKFLRFEGHYHGWMDNVCYGISAPSADALGDRQNPAVFPWSAGLPEGSKEEFIILPWNDLALVEKAVAERHHEIAAIITEPIMCNSGCILPEEGFLQGLRDLCDRYGIALIFDEVITGFRVSLGGAQQYYGITPDLSILAKAIASGYPISAIVGKKEWMSLIEEAKVIHAGTMNSSNATVAAALATIEVLEAEQPYDRIYQLGERLMAGLRQAAAKTDQNLLVQGLGPMVHAGFTELTQVKDYRDTFSYDKARLGKFVAGMHDRGVRVIGRGLWYISAAHTEEDIEQAIGTAEDVLKTL
jgi:glutamate-1-semialdehyde 2,1-aminomutase